MRADYVYRAIFWLQFVFVAVELAIGLWYVAGAQAGVAAWLKTLGFEADNEGSES